MMDAIRAEFRKLLSVRSTYFIVIASLLIVLLFAGYIQGYHNDVASLQDPHLLVSQSTSAIEFVGLILAFAGLLLAGHEYRYSTITYTLTSSNRRLKVLAAKFVVITIFALVTSLVVALLSPLATIIGASLHGHHLAPQIYPVWSTLWRSLVGGWGYAMYAYVLILLLRNQVGSIVTYLLIPLVGENILTLLIKGNAKYLPFTGLQSMIDPSTIHKMGISGTVTAVHQLGVVLAYIVIGLAVSAVLFTRRDAN